MRLIPCKVRSFYEVFDQYGKQIDEGFGSLSEVQFHPETLFRFRANDFSKVDTGLVLLDFDKIAEMHLKYMAEEW